MENYRLEVNVSNTTLLFLSIMGFFLTMITIISCCFARMKSKVISEEVIPNMHNVLFTLQKNSNQTQNAQTVCDTTEQMGEIQDVTVEIHNAPHIKHMRV